MVLNSGRWAPGGSGRDLKLLQSLMACRRVVMGFLQVVRPIYLALIGFDPVAIGVLLSIPMGVGALRSISFGLFSDRYGRKPFLILGGFFSTLRLVMFALYQDFWLLALAQGLGALGEGGGAGQPVVSGFIAERTKKRDRVKIFNAIAVTNGVAAVVGSLMAGLPTLFRINLKLGVLEAHAALFWIGAVLSLLSLCFTLPLEEEKGRGRRQGRRFLEARSWGTIGRFSLVRSTSGLGFGLIASLLPLYFYLRFNVGSEALGPLYALSRLLSVITYLLAPKIVVKVGDVRSIIFTRAAACGIALLFPIASIYQVAAALLIAFRTIVMFGMPLRQSFATGIVPTSETASTIGISNFTRMSARTAAPTLAGYMFAAASLSLPFLSGAVLLSINALLYRLFFYKLNNKVTIK